MEPNILKVVGQVAGIGGIALGVLLIIFRNIIRKNIFPMLKPEYAYRIIRLIIILTFVIAVLGLAAWIYTTERDKVSAPSKIPELDPETGNSKFNPLEISSINLDDKGKSIDVKVRNNSADSTIIKKLKIELIYYVEPTKSELTPSEERQLEIKEELEKSRISKKPLSFEKNLDVSYVIPPKGADRYIFHLDADLRNLYYDNRDGHYQLKLTFYFNENDQVKKILYI